MKVFVVAGFVVFVGLSLGGCFLSSRRNVDHEEDAQIDGTLENVRVGPSSPDGDVEPDAASVDATIPDAGTEDASAVDAAVCSCAAAGPCSVGACDTLGQCIQLPAYDGETCGEDDSMVCSSGRCVVRGCGDGWRERGPMPVRESCDDGNLSDDDGCSSACSVESLVVDADPNSDYEVGGTADAVAIGVDGRDEALVAYVRERLSTSELVALRVSAQGDTVGIPLTLDADLPTPSQVIPVVAGLHGGGWAIAWSAVRQGTYDVVYVVVSSAGVVSLQRIANTTRAHSQSRPSIAALGDGFLIAWQSSHSSVDDPHGGVYARIFSAVGAPDPAEIVIAADRSGLEGSVQVGAFGEMWLAAFEHVSAANAYEPQVRSRRFTRATALDAADTIVGDSPSAEPFVDTYGADGWLVAFETSTLGASGDAVVRVVPRHGPPAPGAHVVAGNPLLREHSARVVAVADASYWSSYLVAGAPRLVESRSGAWSSEMMALSATVESTGVGRPVFARSALGIWVGSRIQRDEAATSQFEVTLLRVP